MVQNKKQTSSKPKFAEVIIGDKEAKEMYEATNPRPRRNPYLKLNYLEEQQNTGISASLAEKYANVQMPLDNKDTERLIRDMVMGKKSYLFYRIV